MGKHKVPNKYKGLSKKPTLLRVAIIEHWVNNPNDTVKSIGIKFNVSHKFAEYTISQYLQKPKHNITLQSRFTTDED
jgi:hypothetical protein